MGEGPASGSGDRLNRRGSRRRHLLGRRRASLCTAYPRGRPLEPYTESVAWSLKHEGTVGRSIWLGHE